MEPQPEPELLALAERGDAEALSRLLASHVPSLERAIELRVGPRLNRRLDAGDIVQETLTVASQRFADWSREKRYSLRVWLRLLAAQALHAALREHHSQKRDLARESHEAPASFHTTAQGVAEWFASTDTSPTEAVRRKELRERVLHALEALDELDREVLVLRHFEQLSNEETAAELGIEPAAASKRFVRALQRIRPALRGLSDDDRGVSP
ncbi:MAG: sigma-70 family RNA polymerase sigma factor [Planctomycetota bacterium]|nr:sigma-70 family RNA polymerase sigma factor [Planctomycetota bacterium]